MVEKVDTKDLKSFFLRKVWVRVPLVTKNLLDSIKVSIPACHVGDPGSIPGQVVFLGGLSGVNKINLNKFK